MLLWYWVFLSINIYFGLVSCLWLRTAWWFMEPSSLFFSSQQDYISQLPWKCGAAPGGWVLNGGRRVDISSVAHSRAWPSSGTLFPLTIPLTVDGCRGSWRGFWDPKKWWGHRLEESGPPVPVWSLPTEYRHWTVGRERKKTFYCVLPLRIWSLLELLVYTNEPLNYISQFVSINLSFVRFPLRYIICFIAVIYGIL